MAPQGNSMAQPAPNDPPRNRLMKRYLTVLPLLFVASTANADMASYSASMTRIDISGMTCAEVQDALQSSGKALLMWHSKSGLPRYGRYVPNDGFCKMQQILVRASVST